VSSQSTLSPAIDCGMTCSGSYPFNTAVMLTATPATDSVFTGWSGDCTGTAECDLMMSAGHDVTATFQSKTSPLTVVFAGTGFGTVTSRDMTLSCVGLGAGSPCSYTYPTTTSVALDAAAQGSSMFGSWQGCDSVGGASCSVTMNGPRTVTITFN
jgi:hypothetical protein